MRKLSETMTYLLTQQELVAESEQAQTQIQENAGPIPPCPKSLEIAPSDLQDKGKKVLKFEAFVNECLNKENKGSK